MVQLWDCENETHVVMRMAWSVHRSHSCTLYTPDLAIFDSLLPLSGCVFEYGGGKMRIDADQVGDATRVVAMPVG
jgi:hypothetical protein